MNVNRRSFFKTLATAVAGFTILPPATTYQRIWRAQRPELDLDAMRDRVYRLAKERGYQTQIDVLIDRETGEQIAVHWQQLDVGARLAGRRYLKAIDYTCSQIQAVNHIDEDLFYRLAQPPQKSNVRV